MMLSARNIIAGKVKKVKKGAVAAEVEVDIGNGQVITSSITTVSAQRLKLKRGKPVQVIIKASEVILGVDD